MPVRYSAPKSKSRRNPSGEQGDGAGRLPFWHDRKLAAHAPIQNNSGLPRGPRGPLVAGWACAKSIVEEMKRPEFITLLGGAAAAWRGGMSDAAPPLPNCATVRCSSWRGIDCRNELHSIPENFQFRCSVGIIAASKQAILHMQCELVVSFVHGVGPEIGHGFGNAGGAHTGW